MTFGIKHARFTWIYEDTSSKF